MRKDPFQKPVKAYRTLGEAFRDADYANPWDFDNRSASTKPSSWVIPLLFLCAVLTAMLY